MQPIHARIRSGRPRELSTLMQFYRDNETDTLPPPPYQNLKDALENGSLLVVENLVRHSIVAAAGYFEYIKSDDRHVIYELAGTRVTKDIGGLRPIPLQQILLALRFIQLLLTEGPPTPISVLSSARHAKSIRNLMMLGMSEIHQLPAWLEYDICSWTRMSDRQNWRHFVAGEPSVGAAIEVLKQVKLADGLCDCYREGSPENGLPARQDVNIRYDLNLRFLFPSMVRAHEEDEIFCNFVPLPAAVP